MFIISLSQILHWPSLCYTVIHCLKFRSPLNVLHYCFAKPGNLIRGTWGEPDGLLFLPLPLGQSGKGGVLAVVWDSIFSVGINTLRIEEGERWGEGKNVFQHVRGISLQRLETWI